METLTEEQRKNTENWIKALLSGKYKQGTSVLKRKIPGSYEYCVMGLSAKIMKAPSSRSVGKGLIGDIYSFSFEMYEWDDEAESNIGYKENRTRSLPPEWMRINYGHWLSDNGTLLINLNDNAGFTFEKMAHKISELSGVPIPQK